MNPHAVVFMDKGTPDDHEPKVRGQVGGGATRDLMEEGIGLELELL
jgi:hypothetical protein